jgi:hypothetical protein
MSYQSFTYQTTGNKQLTAVRASPQKQINDDAYTSFSLLRKQYTRTAVPANLEPAKKWIGSSGVRDSSSVLLRKKTAAISASLNAGGKPMATAGEEPNVVQDALLHLRSNSNVPSAKIRASPHYTHNTPSFAAGPLVRNTNNTVTYWVPKMRRFTGTIWVSPSDGHNTLDGMKGVTGGAQPPSHVVDTNQYNRVNKYQYRPAGTTLRYH